MNTPHEHSIEPLTDAAWQRIENKLFTQLAAQPKARRTHAYAPWAALAAACTLLGIAFAWPASPPSAAQHFGTSTSTQSFVLDDVTLRLDPNTSVSILRGPGSAVSCTLERGTVRFEVAARKGRDPFAVLAEDVRVEVVGTVFSVAHIGKLVTVETHEGVVRVSTRTESMLLRRAERWPAPSEPAPTDVSSPAPLEPSRATSARSRFEEAAACEAKDAKKAMLLYEQLAQEPGSWASNGLFALGRLELERGLTHKGERHLRRYLRLYPNGLNAVDARALLARAARESAP